MLTLQEIECEVISFINEMFNRNIEYNNKIVNESIFLDKVCLSSQDLVYLYFEIQSKYGISIDEKDINEGNFSTINSIARIIEKEM